MKSPAVIFVTLDPIEIQAQPGRTNPAPSPWRRQSTDREILFTRKSSALVDTEDYVRVRSLPDASPTQATPAGKHRDRGVAEEAQTADISSMADHPTRDQMNDRLEAVESRLDSKVAQVGADVRVLAGKMDALATQMAEFRTTFAATAHAIQADVAELRKEGRDERRTTRSLFIGSGLAVVGIVLTCLGTIIAVQYSISGTMQATVANVVSSLQTGVAIGESVKGSK